MPAERKKKIWGVSDRGREGAASVKETSRAARAERDKCKRSLLYFYENVFANPNVSDKRTGLSRAKSIGVIHKMMMDFLTFELTDVKLCSSLADYLPPRNENGEYAERWLWWPKLSSPPSVQDGVEGPISKMFYEEEKLWYGCIIRISGDALTKDLLVPRGFLKSTIGNSAFNLWQIIRDPAIRLLVKSLTANRAKTFLEEVKSHFETNERFRRLFGDLGPPAKRESAWNTEMIKVLTDNYRGRDPTIWAMGMESSSVGGHQDMIVLDDPVGDTNTADAPQRQKTCEQIQHLQAVRDPDSPMLVIGTRWDSDDAHSMLIQPNTNDSTEKACFMVATVSDVDGNSMWPEVFTQNTIARKRRAMPIDKIYYGQYFNQFTGTSARTFSPKWIHTYQVPEGGTRAVAVAKQLNIFIGVDTASGKQEQKGKLDYSCGFVMGVPERTEKDEAFRRHYVLDGFNEKLHAEAIAKRVIDLVLKWRDIAKVYGGSITVGVEENAFTNFLRVALDYEQRERGVSSVVGIEPVKHNNINKFEYIKLLARPYADGRVLWPADGIDINPVDGGDPYDFVAMLREQFVKCPSLSNDDILDGHQIAYRLANPNDYREEPFWKKEKTAEEPLPSREESLKTSEDNSRLGIYAKPGKWGR